MIDADQSRVKSVVLVDPFDKGHHANYAGILASGLSRLGWNVYLVGSEHLISSVKERCPLKGSAVISLASNNSASEFGKYRFLCKALEAASNFNAQRIHLLTLDRMIGALYLALFRFPHLGNIFATLHWGNMLVEESQVSFPSKLRAGLLRFLLDRLIKDRLVLMMHSPALVSRMGNLKRLGYIPYPYDLDEVTDMDRQKAKAIRARENLPESAVVLLCFGETRRDKGADVAVRALSYLPEDYYLFVVGKEGEITGEELLRIATNDEVSSRVKLHLSFISDKDALGYFLAADILLLLYHKSFSGQSGPLVTAAALGLPVVTSPALVLKETVEKYALGVITVEDDEKGIAVAIRNLAITKYRVPLTKEFIKQHSSDNFAANVEAVYLFQ